MTQIPSRKIPGSRDFTKIPSRPVPEWNSLERWTLLLSSLQLRALAPTSPAASSVSSKLANFLLSLAANARQHTRAPRSQKGKEESLCRYLCPPVPTTLFLSPVRRGQKTGRRVALVESPSHHHRLSCPTLPFPRPWLQDSASSSARGCWSRRFELDWWGSEAGPVIMVRIGG